MRLLGAGAAGSALGGCTAANVLSEFEGDSERRERALREGSVETLREEGRALLVAHLSARFGRPDDLGDKRGDAALSLTFGRLGETYRSETIASRPSVLGVDPWFVGSVGAGAYFLVSFAVTKQEARYSASPGLPTFLDSEKSPAIVEFQVEPGDVVYLGHVKMHLEPIRREYVIETRALPGEAKDVLLQERPTLTGPIREALFNCNGCPRF
ncbi:MAG: hypothetical protein AAFW46_04450 [Pseudomonadota bacterium]